ncbi:MULTISPECIES: hypothetical protein [unclassified Streptomyces]|uniref:hypothetical protein n=1 Tax=unclassified Streptomyces TaxID=2593676 RepID=UPI002E19F59A|nr:MULTISPECIES: hypothetical protein [unclassified Streptomyces]
MDSGLAAVLGATVGAVGTGGAGVVAALLARSQSRSLIRAEHARLIREPRKEEYAAYAEASKHQLQSLTEALHRLNLLDTEEPARAEALRDLYTRIQAAADFNEGDLDAKEARVYIEGPREVIASTLKVAETLTRLLTSLWESVQAAEREEAIDIDALNMKRREAHHEYLAFLYSSSEALSNDGLRNRRRAAR